MDEQHVKSAAKSIEGNTKEAVGKATDNEELEAEGKADQVEAEARDFAGDIKDAVT